MSDTQNDTIQKQDVSNALDSDEDVAAALLSKWEPDATKQPSGAGEDDTTKPSGSPRAAQPATKVAPEKTSEQSVDDQTDDEEDEGGTQDEAPEREYVEKDDAYVKVKVGDEEHEVPVKDLKRLAGQEASLTRKGQELATARKAVEETAALQTQVLDTLIAQARVAWEPYSKLDFLSLARNPEVSEEQLAAVRQEAERRWTELQFLENGLKEVKETSQKAITTSQQEAAKACVEALSDPTTGLEGWGEPLYKEIVAYAAKEGVSTAMLNDLTDPVTYKLYRKAMLYDQGKAAVTKIKDTKQKEKAAAPPKKIVKGSRPLGSVKDQVRDTTKVAQKEETFRKSGKVDDAAELLAARWSVSDED